MDFSIIIPCYNEIDTINQNIPFLVRLLENTKYNYEIILYDDCSTDGTIQVAEQFANQYKNVFFYKHEKNTGRGQTVADGFLLAKGKFIGYIDMDFEVSPIYLFPLIIKLEDGYDVAVISRKSNISIFNLSFHKKISLLFYYWIRIVLSKIYSLIVKKIFKIKVEDPEVGFKFFKKEKIIPIIDEIVDRKWFWDTEIMALSYYTGLKIYQQPGLFLKNMNKKTTVKLFRDGFRYLINLYKFYPKIKKKYRNE